MGYLNSQPSAATASSAWSPSSAHSKPEGAIFASPHAFEGAAGARHRPQVASPTKDGGLGTPTTSSSSGAGSSGVHGGRGSGEVSTQRNSGLTSRAWPTQHTKAPTIALTPSMLDGTWLNSERLVVTIRGSRFEAETGDKGTVSVSAVSGQVTMVVEGEVCRGMLVEDGSIRWSDGDVWVRSQPAQGSAKPASPLARPRPPLARGLGGALVAPAVGKYLWTNSQGIKIVIDGSEFRTETGEKGRFNVLLDPNGGGKVCSLECDGETSEGWYESDGSIRWSDGDVWLPQGVALREKHGDPQKSLDQLKDMFPSWEREALADVLATFGGNLEEALNNLLQWTNHAKPMQWSAAESQKLQPATPNSAASAPAARRSSESSGASRGGGGSGASRGVVPEPLPVPRQDYDKVIAARLSRKSNAHVLGHAAKAAVHWRRKAHEGHEAPRRVPGSPKVAWGGESAEERQAPSRSALPSREEQIREGKELLKQRCSFLGLRELEMGDDGNCQFRAVSQELYGTQDHHDFVRAKAVDHLKSRSEDYQVNFAEGEWDTYLADMRKLRTWGDEITLRAVADAFKVHVHLVTSTNENWYLVYRPSDPPDGAREIFLTYVAPIHYNAVEPMR